MEVKINISVGELIDKITILEIKNKNINDENKLVKIKIEMELLNKVYFSIRNDEVEKLKLELFEINSKLWDVEDNLRNLEAANSFGNDFIDNARRVYYLNDSRFAIKDKINSLFGSIVQEVKSYSDYKVKSEFTI